MYLEKEGENSVEFAQNNKNGNEAKFWNVKCDDENIKKHKKKQTPFSKLIAYFPYGAEMKGIFLCE